MKIFKDNILGIIIGSTISLLAALATMLANNHFEVKRMEKRMEYEYFATVQDRAFREKQKAYTNYLLAVNNQLFYQSDTSASELVSKTFELHLIAPHLISMKASLLSADAIRLLDKTIVPSQQLLVEITDLASLMRDDLAKNVSSYQIHGKN